MDYTKNDFLKIIDWLYQINASFGVHHVVIGQKIYWLDTDEDRNNLFDLYKKSLN